MNTPQTTISGGPRMIKDPANFTDVWNWLTEQAYLAGGLPLPKPDHAWDGKEKRQVHDVFEAGEGRLRKHLSNATDTELRIRLEEQLESMSIADATVWNHSNAL